MRALSVFCITLVITMVLVGSSMTLVPVQAAGGTDTLNVNYSPKNGNAPLTVTFQASFSSGSKMQSAEWSFGDNTPHVTDIMNTTHTYQAAGNFTGTLNVFTKDGNSYAYTFQISTVGTPGKVAVGPNATVPNPHANQTNAYNYFLREHNNTLITTTLPPLSIQTNSPSFSQGDTVIIHGAVRDVENQTAVTLRVVNPLKNLVSVAQLIPALDGSFSTKLLATGPLWTSAGNYTVIAQYGKYTNSSMTFYYNGGNGQSIIGPPSISDSFTIQAGGTTYNIPYTIAGGTIQNMQPLQQESTLEITIKADRNGSLTVTLPRGLIESKQGNATNGISQSDLPDKPFIVSIGGKNVKFTETRNLSSRILGIPFHAGDTTIDITGTYAIPEFGPIAALVLAIAIVSIIAVSAKTGLRLMPKY